MEARLRESRANLDEQFGGKTSSMRCHCEGEKLKDCTNDINGDASLIS